jgi:hypothetical protein
MQNHKINFKNRYPDTPIITLRAGPEIQYIGSTMPRRGILTFGRGIKIQGDGDPINITGMARVRA